MLPANTIDACFGLDAARMRGYRRELLNTPEIEIWPAELLDARSNAHARVLSNARRVLRRKRDGRYLLAESWHGMIPLVARWMHEPGMRAALHALRGMRRTPGTLPLTALRQRLAHLGLDADTYAACTHLQPQPEPVCLELAGRDRYRRPLWLLAQASRAWRRMQMAALSDGVVLDAISGYRSHAYQMGIFQRKLQRGLGLDEILAVNAAPGFSEHHSGAALDIGTPGEPPAEECFERTPAFAWLSIHAGRFGFVMSYPRGNPHGIVYEPWHWCWRGPFRAAALGCGEPTSENPKADWHDIVR